jgi:hypothetical protein
MENQTIANIKKILQFLEKSLFNYRSEKSLKELNNWFLGISLGVFSLLVVQANSFNLEKNSYTEVFFLIVMGYAMLNILFAGILKYLIFQRELKINIFFETFQGQCRKIQFGVEKEESFQEKYKEFIDKRDVEFKKFMGIGLAHNFLLYSTAVNIILFGIFVLLVI